MGLVLRMKRSIHWAWIFLPRELTNGFSVHVEPGSSGDANQTGPGCDPRSRLSMGSSQSKHGYRDNRQKVSHAPRGFLREDLKLMSTGGQWQTLSDFIFDSANK